VGTTRIGGKHAGILNAYLNVCIMSHVVISTRRYLANESYALLNRLNQTEPFSVSMPMVLAAGVSKAALSTISQHWGDKRLLLTRQVNSFIQLVQSKSALNISDEELQRLFTRLKLRFNSLLDQFDIFADVVSQRAEYKTGVWIAGLDVLAADALQLDLRLYRAPPLMCFVERGHGAAIRKARTRLPGGDTNPVAIIQVPRERLVGSGIAASIVHEVGHQGVALLDLMPSIRQAMNQTKVAPEQQKGWDLLRRWLSEILADFWALAHLGIGATQGLMSVVGLPTYFMFRYKDDGPHPFPWIRVMISIAFGEQLYPDPQWERFRQLWFRLYPITDRKEDTKAILRQIMACLPTFTKLIINHKNQRTNGQALAALFPIGQRQPSLLRKLYPQFLSDEQMPPSQVFAVVGQARADNRISNDLESQFLSQILSNWARKRAETTILNH
jgi:hypothetical protein